jgi:hypothetical protein
MLKEKGEALIDVDIDPERSLGRLYTQTETDKENRKTVTANTCGSPMERREEQNRGTEAEEKPLEETNDSRDEPAWSSRNASPLGDIRFQ